jgi:hypothetical protein
VIGNGKMIEAYATGFPIRMSSYNDRGAIGFTEPWAGAKGTTRPAGRLRATRAPGQPGAPAPPKGGIPIPGSAISPPPRTR